MKKETEDEYIDIRDFPGLILLMAFYIFSLIFALISCDNWLDAIDAILVAIAFGMPFLGILLVCLVCFWLLLTKDAERRPDDS